jgi:transcription elongation factor Elf1
MKVNNIKNKAIKNAIISKNKKILKNDNNNNIINIDNDNKMYLIKCNKCNKNFTISYGLLKNRKKINTIICTICNPINSSKSGYEVKLYDFINKYYNGIINRGNRKILNNKLELDIYIPELKIAFEFNGLWWHNELHKENKYHLNKTELCEKNNIQLIHIWEDDWLYKQDIIKSMILNKLGKTQNKIYARKTKIKEITDNKLIKNFLEKNHIQGFVGSSVKIGLFYNDELVSLMTFGKKRISMGNKNFNDNKYELLRFCNKLNTNIVGGGSKLFKYFIRNYKYDEIITYANRSYSNGNLYKQLNFNYIGKTEPNYYYIIDGIKHYRYNYRKDKLVKEGFNQFLTEHQIMLNRKIYRIYDSGNLKYCYKI